MGISLKIRTFTPIKLLSNPLTSCSIKNFDFLLLHTKKFEYIILRFLVLTTFGFLLSVFYLYSTCIYVV